MGGIFGNAPTPEFGGVGFIDRTLPAFAAISLAITGVVMLPQSQLILRELGVLTRFRVTPLRPAIWIASTLTVHALLASVSMIFAVVIGVVVFGVTLPVHVGTVIVACILGLAAFLSLGFALTALYPSSGAAAGIGNGLMVVLMITSGAFVPLEVMPPGVRQTSQFSPIWHFINLIKGLWDGKSWSTLGSSTMVLVGMIVVCSCLGVLLFRWDTHR